jgi:carbon monoxide dehydrogenase subunit G
MADYERSTTVGASADAVFAFLADPENLAEYVGPITHVDSIAIEGDPAEVAASDEADAASEAHFLADAANRRVEWGRDEYSGSATVEADSSSISTITFRLHVRDDAEADAIRGMLDQAARTVQRLLLLRR